MQRRKSKSGYIITQQPPPPLLAVAVADLATSALPFDFCPPASALVFSSAEALLALAMLASSAWLTTLAGLLAPDDFTWYDRKWRIRAHCSHPYAFSKIVQHKWTALTAGAALSTLGLDPDSGICPAGGGAVATAPASGAVRPAFEAFLGGSGSGSRLTLFGTEYTGFSLLSSSSESVSSLAFLVASSCRSQPGGKSERRDVDSVALSIRSALGTTTYMREFSVDHRRSFHRPPGVPLGGARLLLGELDFCIHHFLVLAFAFNVQLGQLATF